MAVKAGDKLSEQEILQLLNALSKTKEKFICAHGRPTIWSIRKSEIERKFKRKE
jgi:DNA mismatch repair protein MutL